MFFINLTCKCYVTWTIVVFFFFFFFFSREWKHHTLYSNVFLLGLIKFFFFFFFFFSGASPAGEVAPTRPQERRTGRPRTRPIIVRFAKEKLRDDVYRARTRHKVHNHEHKDRQIFVNEDLTSRRSKLAYEKRQMKSSKKITDCWTYNGKVLVKDLSNRIKEITCPIDLQNS